MKKPMRTKSQKQKLHVGATADLCLLCHCVLSLSKALVLLFMFYSYKVVGVLLFFELLHLSSFFFFVVGAKYFVFFLFYEFSPKYYSLFSSFDNKNETLS